MNIKNRVISINTIIPLSNLGYIDIGYNNQKINYNNIYEIERLSFYNINFNIDQINSLQYPSNGFLYNFCIENSNSNYKYHIYKFNFDFYCKSVLSCCFVCLNCYWFYTIRSYFSFK